MARTNVARKHGPTRTHEGATAYRSGPLALLRRTLMACLLWEDTFYEDGVSVADRIREATLAVKPEQAVAVAIEAREAMKLRHAPLWVARALAGGSPEQRKVVAGLLERVIQRPDELTEFLALYGPDKRQGVKQSAQVKRGLAAAFAKFDAYALAKYNRDGAVTLKDVLRIAHPKPKDAAQAELWKQVLTGTLTPPDTWEVASSAGKEDKTAMWTRLLTAQKLGALALLRNLRNMLAAQVPMELITTALAAVKVDRVLPFRFIAAARYAPELEPMLEAAMLRALEHTEKLPGRTVLLVDVSGSMDDTLSLKSEMSRRDAACGLAILLREVCEQVAVVSFSDEAVVVPARRGFALRDAIAMSQRHNGTFTEKGKAKADAMGYDRLVIITDEQSHEVITAPQGVGYVVNVGTAENGIGYGPWTHIDGWSEAIVEYIRQAEQPAA